MIGNQSVSDLGLGSQVPNLEGVTCISGCDNFGLSRLQQSIKEINESQQLLRLLHQEQQILYHTLCQLKVLQVL